MTRFRLYCSLFVLTGFVCLGISQCAWADLSSQSNHTQMNSQEFMSQSSTSSVPSKIADALRQDVSRRTRIAAEKLSVIEGSRKTWTDGCLGLAQGGEICTQALVEGWRVVVSDGHKSWIYRTDAEGRVIRLESQQ